MPLSSVAVILDDYGGERFVVARRKTLKHHVRHGELLFVVPDFLVQEPVPLGGVAYVTTRAKKALIAWLDTRPNLDEQQHRVVLLWRLHQQRHPERNNSVNLCDLVET